MKIDGLNVTDARVVYLGKIDASDDWIRDCGRTINWRTERKMPEPTYMWLIENGLIDCDYGNLNTTPKGKELLAKYYANPIQQS